MVRQIPRLIVEAWLDGMSMVLRTRRPENEEPEFIPEDDSDLPIWIEDEPSGPPCTKCSRPTDEDSSRTDGLCFFCGVDKYYDDVHAYWWGRS